VGKKKKISNTRVRSREKKYRVTGKKIERKKKRNILLLEVDQLGEKKV